VEPNKTLIAKQRIGKQVSAATDTQATVEEFLERCFLFGPYKVVTEKSSVENNQSSFGVTSEQLVES
jgi:hypothetical protein